MTVRRFTRTTRGSLVASVFALAAVLVLGVAVDAFAPRSSEAQRSGQGFLGVSLQELNDDLRDSYDYHGDGVLVADVTAGSPADRIGIEEGDILVRLGDEEIDDVRDATEYVRSLAPGTRVAVTVFRDGRSRSLGRATIADVQSMDVRDDDRVAPRAPGVRRTPRAPRAPRTPAPRVAPAPPGARSFVLNGRGRLGVQTHDLDRDLGSYFDAPGGRGVLILSVVDDTPADRAGLKAGDVILGVGNDDIATTDDLREALRERDAGSVELRILRNGSRRTIEAELGAADTFDFNRMGNDWMGLLHDSDDGDSDKDKDGKQVRRHVFRLHPDGDGHGFEWDGDSDFRNRMSPEDRARFDERMEKLREDMRELRREMQELHDRRR